MPAAVDVQARLAASVAEAPLAAPWRWGVVVALVAAAHAALWLTWSAEAPLSQPASSPTWVQVQWQAPATARTASPAQVPSPATAQVVKLPPSPQRASSAAPAPRHDPPKSAPQFASRPERKPLGQRPVAVPSVVSAVAVRDQGAAKPPERASSRVREPLTQAAATPTVSKVDKLQSQAPAASEPGLHAAQDATVDPGTTTRADAPPRRDVASTTSASWLNSPKPHYPRLSQRLGEQGVVHLRAQVNAQGRVTAVTLLTSSGYARLDQAAMDAVGQWVYELPAGQQMAPQWLDVPVTFALQTR